MAAVSDGVEPGTSERPSERSGAEVADPKDDATDAAAAPLLRIVNADATPEEIAALVAVFSSLGSDGGDSAPRRTPEWSRPARLVRQPVAYGPGGWRASALPR